MLKRIAFICFMAVALALAGCQAAMVGIATGSQAPGFSLSSLEGHQIGLSGLQGRAR